MVSAHQIAELMRMVLHPTALFESNRILFQELDAQENTEFNLVFEQEDTSENSTFQLKTGKYPFILVRKTQFLTVPNEIQNMKSSEQSSLARWQGFGNHSSSSPLLFHITTFRSNNVRTMDIAPIRNGHLP